MLQSCWSLGQASEARRCAAEPSRAVETKRVSSKTRQAAAGQGLFVCVCMSAVVSGSSTRQCQSVIGQAWRAGRPGRMHPARRPEAGEDAELGDGALPRCSI